MIAEAFLIWSGLITSGLIIAGAINALKAKKRDAEND